MKPANHIKGKEYLFPAFILALGVAARLYCFCGFYGTDDRYYARLAMAVAENSSRLLEGWEAAPVFKTRIGIIGPAALAIRLTGPGEWAVIAHSFAASLGGILLAFWAGKYFFGSRAGLIAAGIQALVPLDARLATMFLPDLPMAFWGNAGFVLVLAGLKKDKAADRISLGAGAGMAFGLAWLCKESAVFLIPAVGVIGIAATLRHTDHWKVLAACATGWLFVGLAEGWFYYFRTGDFLYRFHAVEQSYEVARDWFFAEGSPYGWKEWEYGAALLRRLFVTGPKTLFLNPNFAWIPAPALIAAILVLFKKNRTATLAACWFLSLVIIYNFAPTGPGGYRPLVLGYEFSRYLLPILLPGIVLVAGWIDGLARQRDAWKTAAAILIPGIILLSSLHGLYGYVLAGPGSPVERQVAGRLSPEEEIYTDSRSAQILWFFRGYPEEKRTHEFSSMKAGDIPAGSVVLIQPGRLEYLSQLYQYPAPEFAEDIPAEWDMEWKFGRSKLYRVKDHE